MKQTLYIIFALATVCLLGNCITEYHPSNVVKHDKMLVVESMITDGETVIKLSQSVDVFYGSGGQVADYDLVGKATVWIEGENGTRYDAVETLRGEFHASEVVLNDDVRYRLRISWEGDEYESDYRYPQNTPPIESVKIVGNGDRAEIQLNVNGGADDSRYYLWSYNETWEIHAQIAASHYLGYPIRVGSMFPNPEQMSLGAYDVMLNDDNIASKPELQEYPDLLSPFYYCWKYRNSRELLLASTERLVENTLRDHVLYSIGVTEDCLSVLYNSKIYQFSLGADAYYYFTNQKKNTDESGSIFAPIPSEMQGNIVCTTSPETPAVGFVEVSKRVMYDLWQEPYGSPYVSTAGEPCETMSNTNINSLIMSIITAEESPYEYYLYQYDSSFRPPVMYAIKGTGCIDCREQGGLKRRPSWWPLEHY